MSSILKRWNTSKEQNKLKFIIIKHLRAENLLMYVQYTAQIFRPYLHHSNKFLAVQITEFF